MNRKFDKLGRLSIPKEMRDKIGIGEPGTEANIELIDNKIIITNPDQVDEFEEWLKEIQLINDDDKTINWILDKYLELKNKRG